MTAQYGFTTLSATGRYAVNVDKNGPGDNIAVLQISNGDAWTCTGTLQGNPFTAAQDPDNLGWQNIASIRLDTMALEATPTLTADTSRSWKTDVQAFNRVAFNVSAISGTIPFNLVTYYEESGINFSQVSAVSQAIAGTLTISSASATAATIGPNGATNPVFAVDGSTSSQADGVKVTGLAAGSGVTLVVTTSGTNAPMNINGVGSGNVVMNQAGTGVTVFTTGLQITDAKNIVLATTAGTSLGSATTQKLSFYGVTPVTQPAASSATSVTGTTGSSTGVSLDTTFTGGGTAAFTVGGLVVRLKALGLLAT